MAVNLDQFVAEISKCVNQSVTPDSLLWKDLGLSGDDFSFGLGEMFGRLKCQAEPGFDIYRYIPNEREWGPLASGKLLGRKSIPDISVRQLYAVITFGD